MRERIAELKEKDPNALSALTGPASDFETDDPLLINALQGEFARETIRAKYGEDVLKRLEELCGG